ncbi:MAG TPA: fumarylacetoacetate hydrolase family protein [Mycobacteriales bacterium]|nr:fumarylacetoacetate hydrolase family protein [Mycobacteriales bacterium]
MRIARFTAAGGDVSFGVVEGPGEDPADLVVTAIEGHPFAPFRLSGEPRPLQAVRLLAPVLPSKVVCIGKNYADHIAEMGLSAPADPVVFLKPSTSVIGPGEAIVLPRNSERVDHEAELAIVIGRLCREVPRARALDVVLGYTCGNDVTARDHQAADKQWTRGKSHDTFCPIGPWIETDVDASDVVVQARVDGELKQDGRTSQLIHDIPAVIEWVTAFMTLLPGDVILTGTPAGVGPLNAGQVASVTVGGVGTLTNPVVAPR